MMLLVLLPTMLSGWLVARALTRGLWPQPAWAGPVAAAALGVLLGPGLASILYFALVPVKAAKPGPIYIVLAAQLALSHAWWRFARLPRPAIDSRPNFPWNWVLLAALGLGCVFFALDFQAASAANPNGEWDASAIWNLRARYLAGGPETWRRAISPSLGGGMVGSSHPGYPLLLSSFLAMQWTAAGAYDSTAPILTSLIISLAVLILLVTSLAARRSLSLGVLAGLLLLATELFASQAASQYSDLLEGLAFLAALVLMGSGERPSMYALLGSGFAIGLAPWIKNEGQPFALAVLAVAVWRFRGWATFTLLGALPGFAATAALKLLSGGREAMFPSTAGEAFGKLADVSRWWQAFLGFGKAFLDAGTPWAHPALLAIALALVLRLVPREERRGHWWLGLPIAVTLAAEYGLYLITTADLDWHINTSVTRLWAQVWPSLLWLLFSVLRAPEDYFAPREPVPVGVREPAAPGPKGKKRRAAA